MKRFLSSIALAVVLFVLLPVSTQAAELLIPVGRIIGLQLSDDTVTIAAFDETLGENAKAAGLKIGDEIVEIDDTSIDSVEDVRSALSGCGDNVELTVRRSGKLNTIKVCPQKCDDGPRLGVYLRQGIAGIGTVTWYDPDTGKFGTLGHGVSDAKGDLLCMKKGSAYEARVISVKKGKCGEPGQLKGNADGISAFGKLLRNTPQGVFGITRQGWAGEPVPVASFDEIHTGEATIRATVIGDTVQEYSVEVLKIYPKDRTDGRNLLIKVTDPELLAVTGGIVQGMSGSPLIQDGKLIGAVTHVLVNDPTTGYGIFIENMLDAAS